MPPGNFCDIKQFPHAFGFQVPLFWKERGEDSIVTMVEGLGDQTREECVYMWGLGHWKQG